MTAVVISQTLPEGFQPVIKAAGCYCEFEDKLLLLKRSPHKPSGNTWGIPGGKLDSGETPETAVVREVYEEVGLEIREGDLEDIGKVYVQLPNKDTLFYRFSYRFLTLPVIKLGLEEHTEARWLTVDQALELPLIAGGRECLLLYRD